MKTYKNRYFVNRNCEGSKIVYCTAETIPNKLNWIEVSNEELQKSDCQHLYTHGSHKFYGYK